MTLLTDDEHKRLRELCDAPSSPYMRDVRPLADQWYPLPRTISVDVEIVLRLLAEREARLAADAEVMRLRSQYDDVAEERDDLDQLIAVREEQLAQISAEWREWQPISEAPKDGTWVLLWWPAMSQMPSPAHFLSPLWYDLRDETREDGPTHWQPLPLPPAGAE